MVRKAFKQRGVMALRRKRIPERFRISDSTKSNDSTCRIESGLWSKIASHINPARWLKRYGGKRLGVGVPANSMDDGSKLRRIDLSTLR